MPTDVFAEVANGTGYHQKIGVSAATAVISVSPIAEHDYSGSSIVKRAAFSYNTGVIPATATLVSATLDLYVFSVIEFGSIDSRLMRVYVGWDIWGGTLVNGNTQYNFILDTVVGEFDSPTDKTTYSFNLDPPGDFINFEGTNPGGTYTEFQVRKVYNEASGDAYSVLFTLGYTKLTVVYTVPGSIVPVVYTFGG